MSRFLTLLNVEIRKTAESAEFTREVGVAEGSDGQDVSSTSPHPADELDE